VIKPAQFKLTTLARTLIVCLTVVGLALGWELFINYLEFVYPTNPITLEQVHAELQQGGAPQIIITEESNKPLDPPLEQMLAALAPDTEIARLEGQIAQNSAGVNMVAASVKQLSSAGSLQGPKGDTGSRGHKGSFSGAQAIISNLLVESSAVIDGTLNLVGQLEVAGGLVLSSLGTDGLLQVAEDGTVTAGDLTVDLTDISTVGGVLGILNGGTGTTTSTGIGSLVLSDSPTLVEPILGTASATSLNNLTITPALTGAVLTIADGKTLNVENTLAFLGTDDTEFILPTASDTIVGRTSAVTLTNKVIAAGSNTISGLTNSNLSGAAGISNTNLANSSITVTLGNGLSGGGVVSLGASIALTNTGVTALTGTSNQVSVSGDTGAVTLSLPQNIAPGSSPTFAALSLSTALTPTSGGTGLSSLGSANQLLTVNTSGTAYEYKTLSVGSNLSLTPGAGTLAVGLSATPSFTTVNGLTLTAAVDGLTISGGATSRTINVSGGNITLAGSGHTLTLGASSSLDQDLTSSSSPTFSNLGLSSALTIAGSINGNNPTITSGTLANTALSGTCVLNVNASALAAFQSSATVTTSHIFYNADSARHSRITSISTCTDGSGNPWRVLVLSDSVSGNSSGDSYTIYQNNSSIGTTASGFIGTINAVSLRSLVSTLTGGFDIAEQYPSLEVNLSVGDVVSIDPLNSGHIRKSAGGNDPYVLGVISSKPALTLGGEFGSGWQGVALSGRVPVKVTGLVKAGDYLTSSNIAGVAQRAAKAGPAIGRALEDHLSEGQGQISMFVLPGQSLGSLPVDAEDPLFTLFEKMLQPEPVTPSLITADVVGAGKIGAMTVYAKDIAAAFEDSLRILPQALFNGGLKTDYIASLSGLLKIESDIELGGRVLFDRDTAGYAKILSNESLVDVHFQREFVEPPVVTASLATQDYQTQAANFSITNISGQGFTIQLDQPALTDISLSWIALAVPGIEEDTAEPRPPASVEVISQPQPMPEEQVLPPEPEAEAEPGPVPNPVPDLPAPQEDLPSLNQPLTTEPT
jgi:hypothetical protein